MAGRDGETLKGKENTFYVFYVVEKRLSILGKVGGVRAKQLPTCAVRTQSPS